MPMKSSKQRSFLWAKHPEIAEKFEKDTPAGAHLPEYAGDSDEPKKPKMMGMLVRKRKKNIPY